MKTPVTAADLEGVFAVPPLARAEDGRFDPAENDAIARHLRSGGITRLLYGGNAFLYHVTLADYEALLDWMAAADRDVLMIPSLGPAYGRAIDQARIIRRYGFPAAMLLPCGDPRDAAGLERGVRSIADAAGCPVVLYLKEETTFGSRLEEGLDAIGRLAADGVCAAVKYAVVRRNPEEDSYLSALIARVERQRILSGMGERPAVVHMRYWRLPGFTTGSGCLAPRLTLRLFEACRRGDFAGAGNIRREFLPLEDVRDAEGPARVLHAAVGLAGIARVGPIPPFVSPLASEACAALETVVRALLDANERALCEAS
ncbi:MAG TPA: dihydrodipicolinate synthase family protein [Vicinamibacterales bacterium]|nr:dihydrodipicolinate synthase family protein [Vicinamibacterales bacterium]